MTLRVPPFPLQVMLRNGAGNVVNTARIGTPLMGAGQWVPSAMTVNWLLGAGTQLAWSGPVGVLAQGATYTFRSYVYPRPGHRARLWTIAVRGAGATGAVATVDRPGGVVFSVAATQGGTHVFYIAELVADPVEPTGEEAALVVVNSFDGPSVIVTGITCYELPLVRVGLTGDDLGVHERSCSKEHPIMERESGGELFSVYGVAEATRQLREGPLALRRAKMFDWYHPTGVTMSSSTFANVFRLNPAVQARRLSSANTRTVHFAVRASASASAGQVRIASTATGVSNTVNITSTTQAWVTGTIGVAVDDFDEDMWLPNGARETLIIDQRATSGNVNITAVAVAEGGHPPS